MKERLLTEDEMLRASGFDSKYWNDEFTLKQIFDSLIKLKKAQDTKSSAYYEKKIAELEKLIKTFDILNPQNVAQAVADERAKTDKSWAELVFKLLVKIGVANGDASPTVAEILMATEEAIKYPIGKAIKEASSIPGIGD